MYRYVLIKIIAVSLFATLFYACKSQRYGCSEQTITYYIFDSLEQTILHDVAAYGKRATIKGIIIDSKATAFTHEQWGDRGNDSIFQFGVVISYGEKSKYLNHVEKTLLMSDRYVKIGKKKVPVYIYHLDDIFDENNGSTAIYNGMHSSRERALNYHTVDIKNKRFIYY